MTDFTASNGMQIRTHPSIDEAFGIFDANGNSTLNNSYDHLNLSEMQALREFFQAEADERLGRWRWPENPDYVVYPIPGADESVTSGRVFRESTSAVGFYYLTDSGENTTENMGYAARAYFDAHPEPKPWHDAKPGEAWEIATASTGPSLYVVENTGNRFIHVERRLLGLDVKAAEIVSGRPIWTGEAS